ncbi:MAG TPA: hypothetical protein VFY35_00790 [Burkholderiaceae bacterium]|nr:hypothetical protein [Burkholderiaceae bacterium]
MIDTAVMLKLVEECGENILVLMDGIEPQELARSRLTRQTVLEQVNDMARALDSLPGPLRSAMPELDWDGWRVTASTLAQPGTPPDEDALWFAIRSLVPATLSWLRVYRLAQPEWFVLRA